VSESVLNPESEYVFVEVEVPRGKDVDGVEDAAIAAAKAIRQAHGSEIGQMCVRSGGSTTWIN